MIEFFMGFIVGITSVVLSGLAYFIVKEPDFVDKDYNMIEKSISNFVDNKNDPENYFSKHFKKEGTK
tara:strand:+ start:76 stop:276 length:201 start_codon:yes stop_codon:yes gene_type:complete